MLARFLWGALVSGCVRHPQLSPARCPGVPGAEEVLARGTLVMLGEMHGTREVPLFVAALACQAAERGPVAIGLELPEREQPLLDLYLASTDPDAARHTLLTGDVWMRDYQDGRSSEAMLQLLETLRRLKRGGAMLSVFAFDPEGYGAPAARERRMAELLRSHQRADTVTLALMGNIHNRTIPGVPWDPDYVPAGAILSASTSTKLVSLDGAYAQGEEWACSSADASSCGVVPLQGDADPRRSGITLFSVPSPEGYHGRFYVGSPSASPPAARAKD
jgi:hypothetical protein